MGRAGLSAGQLAKLDALRLEVADLPGLTLGQLQEGVITIDADAAGWGWFIDPTPSGDEEFALALSQDQHAATPDSPAYRQDGFADRGRARVRASARLRARKLDVMGRKPGGRRPDRSASCHRSQPRAQSA